MLTAGYLTLWLVLKVKEKRKAEKNRENDLKKRKEGENRENYLRSYSKVIHKDRYVSDNTEYTQIYRCPLMYLPDLKNQDSNHAEEFFVRSAHKKTCVSI